MLVSEPDHACADEGLVNDLDHLGQTATQTGQSSTHEPVRRGKRAEQLVDAHARSS